MLVKPDKFKLMEIDRCVKADWNYKDDNEELTVKLMENIKRNGQVENLLVRSLESGFLEVVNGNHRYEALKRLGAKNVMVYDLGTITNAEAYRIAVETNETKFTTDQVKLSDLIKDMTGQFSQDELLATMPYTAEQLANLLAMADFDWDAFNDTKDDSTDVPELDETSLVLKLTPIDAERWERWVQRAHKLTDADTMGAFRILLTLVEQMSDEAVQGQV